MFFAAAYHTNGGGQQIKEDHSQAPSSARSKVKTSRRHEHNEGFLAGVAIGVAAGALVLLAIVGIALYRKFWSKSLHTINFDNPVYRKTAEENAAANAINLERDPSSVSMTSSMVTSSTSVLPNTAKRSYTSNTLATDVSEVNTIVLATIHSVPNFWSPMDCIHNGVNFGHTGPEI